MIKRNISKAIEQRQALEKLILLKGHGLGYELNLNLFRVRLKIEDWSARFKEIENSFIVKDGSGEPVKVLVNSKGMIVKDIPFDANLELAEGTQWGNKFDPERAEERQEAVKKMNEELIEWDYKPLPKAKIMELNEKGILDGVDYSSLLDVLIEI
jgi:hypothetical protein